MEATLWIFFLLYLQVVFAVLNVKSPNTLNVITNYFLTKLQHFMLLLKMLHVRQFLVDSLHCIMQSFKLFTVIDNLPLILLFFLYLILFHSDLLFKLPELLVVFLLDLVFERPLLVFFLLQLLGPLQLQLATFKRFLGWNNPAHQLLALIEQLLY